MDINKVKDQIQKSIISKLEDQSHGLLNLAPRVGKTKIGIEIIKKEKPSKILWVTPSTKLRDEDIPAEFVKWKAKTFLKKADIICYASLADHKGSYDKIILDEYQYVTENNMEPFFSGKIKFNTILGLSGTHPEHDEKNEIYDKLKLPVLHEIPIDKAVELGLIAPYEINVIEVALDGVSKSIEAGSKNNKFKTTEKSAYEYIEKKIKQLQYAKKFDALKFFYLNRMRFVHNSPTKLKVAKQLLKTLKGRKLVFCSNIKQSEQLTDNLYNSKTDDTKLKQFVDGKIDELACVNSGGVGFTYRNVDHFVIVQTNNDKAGDVTQKIARSLVLQDGYVAKIWIICLLGTQDEAWVKKVLSNFNSKQIKYSYCKLDYK